MRDSSEKLIARGRPREFDVDAALSRAMQVFWSKSYAGASLSDLTTAMGISRPSLYAAFGNKDALFKRAFGLYATDRLSYVQRALEAPTARGVAEQLLEGTIENVTDECRGCLGVIVLVDCDDVDPLVRDEIQNRIQLLISSIVERFQCAIDDGDFTQPATAESIAQYLIAVLQGISVQARTGVGREELQKVSDMMMATWPSR